MAVFRWKTSVRGLLLNLHLYVGFVAAAFLIVLGITGCILAFEDDYDRWLHPSLCSVVPRERRVTSQSILDEVERGFAPARVAGFFVPVEGQSEKLVLTDGSIVFVDPHDGAILGRRDLPTGVARFVRRVRDLHVALAHARVGDTDVGKWLVDAATVAAIFLIPTGVYLWWRRKRLAIRFDGGLNRVSLDLHRSLGVLASLVLFVLAATGLLIAYDEPLFWITRSSPQEVLPRPHSVPPAEPAADGHAPTVDEMLRAADEAYPRAATVAVELPQRPRDPLVVSKRLPPQVAGDAATDVFVDRYTGRVLRVDDVRSFTRAYRTRQVAVAIHTGAILGLPTQALTCVASLLASVLAVTGVVVGWMRLRWIPGRLRRRRVGVGGRVHQPS